MSLDAKIAGSSATMKWAGRILSVLVVAMLAMSGVMKLMLPPDAEQGFEHLGWPVSAAVTLAVLELGSSILYVLPQTAVLGAILVTGYLGGATATHVRIGEYGNSVIPVVLGVLAWLGLYLRDGRLRALVPLRSL